MLVGISLMLECPVYDWVCISGHQFVNLSLCLTVFNNITTVVSWQPRLSYFISVSRNSYSATAGCAASCSSSPFNTQRETNVNVTQVILTLDRHYNWEKKNLYLRDDFLFLKKTRNHLLNALSYICNYFTIAVLHVLCVCFEASKMKRKMCCAHSCVQFVKLHLNCFK